MLNNVHSSPRVRATAFTDRLDLDIPILLAPMAGACPPSLSIGVANAGGLGACGALTMQPDEIRTWSDDFRKNSQGHFQINLWIPGPVPERDFELERRQREFLALWGPPVPPEAGDVAMPNFEQQCQTILDVRPKAVSSIMGIYAPDFVHELKKRGILWFATVTTAAEARIAEEAGADAIVAQGIEAGGHRGSFHPDRGEGGMVGGIALVPQVVDSVAIPVIATGGIADGRGVAAALALGASAVQIGTGFLRSPEAKMNPTYADTLARTEAHETVITRAFSGRPGRSVATEYVRAASAPEAPSPAPYPVQRGLGRALQEVARKSGDPQRLKIWSGQAGKLAQDRPVGAIARSIWEDACRLIV